MRGLAYGDIIGSPFTRVNTSSRYFEIARTHTAPFQGRVAAFHPGVTGVTVSAAATAAWLTAERHSPTAEGLLEALRRAYAGRESLMWDEPVRTVLSDRSAQRMTTPDPSLLARVVPVVEFSQDRDTALSLASLCAGATCSEQGSIDAARALADMLWTARKDGYRTLESIVEPYLTLPRPMTDEDLRCELQGMERTQLEMLGQPIEGAYTYREPSTRRTPDPMAVVLAAARCTDRAESWEDAVRRAVSMGGPSDLVAALAGAAAEIRFGEPRLEAGMGEVLTLVPRDVTSRIESFERMLELREPSSGREQDLRDASMYTDIQRQRNTEAFGRLVAAVRDIQSELMEIAGHQRMDAQVRFPTAAYALYEAKARNVSVYRGPTLLESITLGDNGIIRIGTGDAIIASAEARTDRESLRESVEASRSVLSREMMADPADRMGQIIAAIRGTILDEETSLRTDTRDMDATERLAMLGEPNRDVLDRDVASGGVKMVMKGFSYSVQGEKRPREATRTVYMIGFSNRSAEEYTGLLKVLGVDTVIDVRSIQRSRSNPQFDSEAIDNALYDARIDYIDGSRNLGGRQEAFLDASGRVDWEAMRKGEEYRGSLNSIASLMKKGHTVAISCSEGSPMMCHRTATIARDLADRGAAVNHVLRNGEVVSHEVLEGMLVEKYTQKGLIDDRKPFSEQVDRSFREMNAEHGWKPERNRARARSRGLER